MRLILWTLKPIAVPRFCLLLFLVLGFSICEAHETNEERLNDFAAKNQIKQWAIKKEQGCNYSRADTNEPVPAIIKITPTFSEIYFKPKTRRCAAIRFDNNIGYSSEIELSYKEKRPGFYVAAIVFADSEDGQKIRIISVLGDRPNDLPLVSLAAERICRSAEYERWNCIPNPEDISKTNN